MKPRLNFMTGFRPVIHAREGRMLGVRNPLDGPVFDTLQDAIDYSIGVMANHFDRGLGLSDARIERFKGRSGKRMTWTTQIPTVSGFYWWRQNEELSADVVHVEIWSPQRSTVSFPGTNETILLHELNDCMWFGPLEVPP